MSRREISGSRVLITGASSGIGRELALQLSADGARLVLVARREERLNEIASQLRANDRYVEIVVGDVTDPAARQAALDRCRTAFGGLDVLVNNAGVGAVGRFEDADSQRLRQIMEVNVFAAAEMIRSALPLLKQGRDPMVVNIGSILGHRGIPLHSEYCASKFALRGLSESLRPELSKVGIDLLLVSPGTTETEFSEHVLERKGDTSWANAPGVPAAVVARKTIQAIRRGKTEIIPNGRGRLLVWLNRFSPRLLDWWLARYG